MSEGYAWEIMMDMGGWGFVLMICEFGEYKFSGIVNGIDLNEWLFDIDYYLDGDGYARYESRVGAFEDGKCVCKFVF